MYLNILRFQLAPFQKTWICLRVFVINCFSQDACSAVQRLLGQQYIKHAIDDNTDNKRKSSLTWDLVFSKAKEFVLSEIEHLEILSSKKRGADITKSTETSRASRVSVSADYVV